MYNEIEELTVTLHGTPLYAGKMSWNDAATWILNRTDNNNRGDISPYVWFDYLSSDARVLENWCILRSDDPSVKAALSIEHDAERAFFRSHPELNP